MCCTLAAAAVACPAMAAAQQAAPVPPPPPDASTAGEDIVVTAERVRGSAIGTDEPVAVLNQAAIASLGATSLGELLKRVKGLTTSADGSDPVFLLNGRRLSGFEEIQTLPPEAMERVEILPEGDAARFGFPPTVRVTNFITKKRFRAVAAHEVSGTATEGGGGANYAELVSTRIDRDRRTSLSLSYFRQNPVLQSQRAIVPDPATPFAIGGNVTGPNGARIDPALDALAGETVTVAAVPADAGARGSLAGYAATANRPAVTDIGAYRSLQQQMDTLRAEGTIAAPIGRTMTGSLNLAAEAQHQSGLNGLATAALDVPPGGALPFAQDVVVDRYIAGGVLRQRNTSLNLHGAGTLQGSIRRWTWSVTGGYDRVGSDAYSERGVPLTALQAAIDAGGDPLAPIDSASLGQRIADTSHTVTGTLTTKAVANGPLVHLPAGDALVTLSADYARSTSDGTQAGLADPALRFGRTTGGASVNADVPIASRNTLSFMGQLTANGMIGVSDVSNYGRLTSSNYGLTWTPTRVLQLAASVNEAQTPPAIALLSAPTLVTPNTPYFDFLTGTSALVTTVVGGNPALAPERRRVTRFGAALKPLKDKEFRVNLDYLETRIADQTGTLGSATAAFQQAFPSQFLRSATGALAQVDLRPVNLAAETERKLRLGLDLWTPLGHTPPPPPKPTGVVSTITPPPPPPKPRPSLFVNLTANYRLEDRLMLAGDSDALDLLDGATLTGTGGRPRWDVDGNISLSKGPANVGVYARIQGPTRIRSELAASDLRFSGRDWLVLYSLLDVQPLVRKPWARKLSVQFTVENLLNDRIAVRDRNGDTPNRFQSAYLDPIGRSIRLGVRKLF
ncbi:MULTISPECIES: TonB-dependent receptor plug domain-containing protein [unclassified Sphingomonas]|uniref:TonB-dependent receptor plug domain-containing protein n=1 Tax=unclassified Sphingomonas TaxID=196159 RepID=UPI00226ACC2C|nr:MULTISPECIES: TonB-dependent receptor plug domain-containing protein [unclassified Sphingomonas]